MNKHRYWALFITTTFLIVAIYLDALIVIVNYCFKVSIPLPHNGIAVGARVNFLALLAIAWTAWETLQMRKSAQEQLNFDKDPRVDLYYYPSDGGHKARKDLICCRDTHVFVLRNEGGSPAYNVEVEEIRVGNNRYSLSIQDANKMLAPRGDSKHLDLRHHDDSEIAQGVSKGAVYPLNELFKDIQKQNMLVAITYQNADETNFRSVFRIEKDYSFNRIAVKRVTTRAVK